MEANFVRIRMHWQTRLQMCAVLTHFKWEQNDYTNMCTKYTPAHSHSHTIYFESATEWRQDEKNGNKMKRNCILGAIIICTNGIRA